MSIHLITIFSFTLFSLMASALATAASFGPQPGEYAIRTMLKGTYLTARYGNHSIDAVTTAALSPGPTEKFHIESMQPSYTLFITASNRFVSAAGGRGGDYDATQTLQTERTTPADDALFKLYSSAPGYAAYTIQTYGNYYLTALGGGGKSTAAFHTDATKPNTWEYFLITQCGAIGSGYDYAIVPKGLGRPITAVGGGVKNVVSAYGGSPAAARLKFLRQPNGWYALQTSDRFHYITAIKGGGLTSGTKDWDNLVTDRTQVQAWETFAFMSQGNCTYTFQASNGAYIGVNQGGTSISTAIPNPATGMKLGYNVYFDLIPFL